MSTDQAARDLVAALQLLQEAADYLERLPAVPATRHLAERLRRFRQAAEPAPAPPRPPELHGTGPYTPAGLPMLEVTLDVDGVARIGLPSTLHGAARDYVLRQLIQRHKRGRTIGVQLRPPAAT